MNWAYFARSVRHLSAGQLVARYAYRGVNRLVDVKLYHGLCLRPEGAREPPPPSVMVEYRCVAPERLREEAADPQSGLLAEDLEAALADGEECFGAFIGDVLASYLWFSPSRAHLQGNVFVRFDPAFAYSRWAFTRTSYRGLRLNALCKRRALDVFSTRGKRGILSVVSAINFDSLKSATRVGSERVGLLGAASVVGARAVWASAGCKAPDLRLERSA